MSKSSIYETSNQIGINGSVISETKNLLYVKSGNDTKKDSEKYIGIQIQRRTSQRFIVQGEEINFRSHERTEKALRFYKRRRMKSR